MQLTTLIGGAAATLALASVATAGSVAVTVHGKVEFGSLNAGPLAGLPSQTPITVTFDVTTPGAPWAPAPADGNEYTIDASSFLIEANGNTVDMSTGSGSLVLIDGFPVSDRLQINATGLPSGYTFSFDVGFTGATFDSLDITEQFGFYDFATLTSYNINMGGAGFMSIEFESVEIAASDLGAPMCFGDGSSGACPCANESTVGAGEGCANSTGVGAVLTAIGSGTVAADDAVFTVSQARPGQTAMLVQGQIAINTPFKDGILCMGGNTYRIEPFGLDASGQGSTSSSVVTEGNVMPGQTRYYQVWYRDPAVSPCGSGSNFSNGLEVNWL